MAMRLQWWRDRLCVAGARSLCVVGIMFICAKDLPIAARLYRCNRERPSGSGCFTSLVPSVRLVAVLLNPNNPN